MSIAPPGPPSFPPLGQLVSFHRDTTGFLFRLAARYGDVVRFRLGRRPAFLAAHPDQVRRILVDDADRFGRGRLMEKARPILGDGLLTSENPLHRERRRAVMAAFRRDRIAAHAAALPAAFDALSRRWNDGVHDLVPALDRFALDLIAGALFGADVGVAGRQVRDDLAYVGRLAPLLVIPGVGSLPIGPIRRAREALGRIDREIAGRIARGRLDPASIVGLLGGGPGGGGLCPAGVRDEAMGLFLAGHDTTAAALGWIWHLLASHPAAQAAVADEAERAIGRGRGVPEDPDALPFASAVVAEALRLFPPISRIGRRSREDYRLDGHVVPAGSTIFVSPFVTQRDARWFEAPDRFEPGRWAATPRWPRWAYFPFGAGSRSCVGEPLARLTLTVTVAMMAARWRFEPAGPPPRASRFLTLRLRRLSLRVARRSLKRVPRVPAESAPGGG